MKRKYIFHIISIYRRKLQWKNCGYWELTRYQMWRCLWSWRYSPVFEARVHGRQGCLQIHCESAAGGTKVDHLPTVRKRNIWHSTRIDTMCVEL